MRRRIESPDADGRAGAESTLPRTISGRPLRTIEAAALAGILHSICLTISLNLLLVQPGLSASEEQVTAYYRASHPGLRGSLGFNLAVFGVIGFIWFEAVIRNRIGAREIRFFSTVFFGGGILYAALTLVGVAALSAPLVLLEVGGHVPDAGAAFMARSFGVVVLAGAVPRVQALVVLATAGLGRATGTLPTWLVGLSYLFGLALLVMVTFFTPTVYGFPVWVVIVSLVLLVKPRDRSRSPDGGAMSPDEMRGGASPASE